MIGVLVKVVAMGFFQVAGVVRPRVTGQGLATRDTVINLINGAALFALKLALLNAIFGLIRVRLVPLDWLPNEVAQFAFTLVLLDFTRYWVHYADHRVPALWSFHRVHHSSERLDATSGLRMHLVDFLQLAALPVVLFGVIFDERQLAGWVLPAALAVADVFDAFEHSNLKINMNNPLARAWNLLLNNPHFHSWHHTRDGALCDGNYANTFIIWDRLFGTDVTRPEPPALMGLDETQNLENSPLGLQLLRRRAASAPPAASP